ncbi:MAG: 50S ribosomal protein L24 [Ignavibacteriales bacterium]|nr:MAG: 50S ribosomal protein L24 [Ignavibacteriaceae bacterium]MBW7873068.1 50S ribosomal protein L24 [Ignavibacteria bacterium]MBZ0196352.1 50S ribosomal protein L24 [Ignavibacteriaceae bacterium]MCZ2142711.1 50S ribosomal protein L24 [Ignavibacteriales bacterium]WKZ73906.1 MAG: 50S ribosomal protein L24 [Ignavibacteriaceae bacterium]
MHLKKNDKVVVISGNDKGSTGRILKIFKKTERIIVEGVNLRKRHTKPNQTNPQGGIIEKEAPIHLSNVMLIDAKTGTGTRLGGKLIVDEKTGKEKIVRISVKSGEMI